MAEIVIKRHLREDSMQHLVDDFRFNFLDTHAGYPTLALHAAFDLVANKENWKYPIDAVIPTELVPVVVTAIRYIAGGGAQVTVNEHYPEKSRVQAPGYYNVIGA